MQTKGSLGTTTTYTYDAGGTRVRKRTPSEETTYVGGLYERRKALVNGPQTEHVFYVPGESAIARQVTYEEATGAERRDVVAEDALGTVSGVIDAAGVVSEKRYYHPYGRKVLADGAAAPMNGPVSDVRRGFTGHEEDAESGLTNMRGRMYDPGQRRFVTPDPFVSDPFFGQGLNRYAYVTNNPLRWVDPSGFEQSATPLPMRPRPNLDRLLAHVTAGQAQSPGASSPSESPATDASTSPTEPQKADEPGTEPPPIGPPPPPPAPGSMTCQRNPEVAGRRRSRRDNKAGDKVFINKAGTWRVRFDINNPSPHQNPHSHVEELTSGKWLKSGPIYPTDVVPQ